MKERYLIIDGYNMIGQSPTLSAIAKENLEEARLQLIDAIANYNAVISDEIICVFDAYEQSGIEREYMYMVLKRFSQRKKRLRIVSLKDMCMNFMTSTQNTLQLLLVI